MPRPASLFKQGARRALAAVLPPRVFLARGPRSSRAVCLTFDDGPHPELTPRLLDLLAQLEVVATFFVIGSQAEKHPDLVRRIVQDGHALGNHTYSHPQRSEITARAAADEVSRCSELLAHIVGRSPALFRPPRGQVTARDLLRLWRERLTTVLWNVDPKDYKTSSADELREWFRARGLTAGDIVLLHDTHPHAIQALPDVVASARARGLQFTHADSWTK